MLDLKSLKAALDQLEQERKIPREKIIEAIEGALAAAYKKEYGKKGQIIRAHFDLSTGEASFEQVKIVVDESIIRMEEEGAEEEVMEIEEKEGEEKVRFNPEHHILLEDAKKIKKNVKLEDELVFPLEAKEDYGRIAAQTAKQVILQKIREAERDSIMSEFSGKEGEVVSGFVERVERGNIYIDIGRTTGLIGYDEQIPGERVSRGSRIKAYLYEVEESPRGITLKLSRAHPMFLAKLFEAEVPEISSGVVEIRSIAREAGSRSKIAVSSRDSNIDPVGSLVGQRGIRVTAVMAELSGEKIDIIPWSPDPEIFIASALQPAKVLKIEVSEESKEAVIEVEKDQLSLAIGRGGQNVRLAAKLTSYRIDIRGLGGVPLEETLAEVSDEETGEEESKREGSEKKETKE